VILAGNAEARKSYAGIKGGLNIANLTGDDADNLDSHNGFVGGVFYGVDFTDDFGARLEGLYVMGGAEGPYPTPDGDTHESTISLDYIQFPLLFVVKIPTSEKITFNLALGPTFSFNTTAEVEVLSTARRLTFHTVNGFEFRR
jgi:hypothetical protein